MCPPALGALGRRVACVCVRALSINYIYPATSMFAQIPRETSRCPVVATTHPAFVFLKKVWTAPVALSSSKHVPDRRGLRVLASTRTPFRPPSTPSFSEEPRPCTWPPGGTGAAARRCCTNSTCLPRCSRSQHVPSESGSTIQPGPLPRSLISPFRIRLPLGGDIGARS